MFGDGGQTRSFCYVDDLIEGILRLLRCDYVGPVNIGNPQEMSAARDGADDHPDRGLAEPRSSTAACRPTIRRCVAPTSRSRAACSRWEPRVPVEDGLRRTYAWFRAALEAELAAR